MDKSLFSSSIVSMKLVAVVRMSSSGPKVDRYSSVATPQKYGASRSDGTTFTLQWLEWRSYTSMSKFPVFSSGPFCSQATDMARTASIMNKYFNLLIIS